MGAATSLYSATCFTHGKYGNGNPYPANLSAVVGLSGWLPCSKLVSYIFNLTSFELDSLTLSHSLPFIWFIFTNFILFQDFEKQIRRTWWSCRTCCILAHIAMPWQRYFNHLHYENYHGFMVMLSEMVSAYWLILYTSGEEVVPWSLASSNLIR